MTWEQRYRLRQIARTSLVSWAALAMIAALLTAYSVRWLDHETGWKIFDYTPDGARAVLGVLVGAMLTFIVFVLSATLIVVQLASGQLTPRVIALVLALPGVKIALGLLTFTYVYTLVALGRIEDKVPDMHVGIAVILNLVCIVVFFMFVQLLSSGLRPATLMGIVAAKGRDVIRQVYPTAWAPEHPEQTRIATPSQSPVQVVESNQRSGSVMAFSAAELMNLARQADAVIELVPQVGDFVATGDPIFRISTASRSIAPADLQGCIAIGVERTLEQDPRFVFRILVDIANKALSPAINDPTTAVCALDQIHDLLLCLGRRHLDEGMSYDQEGKLRLVYGTPDWPDFVMLAVSEIRQFGAGSLQVDRRLRAMLEHLINALPEERSAPLKEELMLLGSSVERGFGDAVDRKRAGVADYQGVGGSESQF